MNDDDIAEGLFEENLEGIYENPDLIDEDDEGDEDEHYSDEEEAAADQLAITNENITLVNKTLKRKEKFEKLKQVKKTKYEAEEPNQDITSRSIESMAEIIQSSEPISNINASTTDLKLSISAVNFIDPSKSLVRKVLSSFYHRR
jgi:predicted lipoprotein